jgi:hypothetical protein
MAAHIFEAMLSYNTAAMLQKQHVRDREIEQTFGVMPGTTILLGYRCEVRMEYRCLWSYQMLEAIDEGEAFALNRSTEGMLLFMGLGIHAKKLIEVHTPRSGWGRTVNVIEARWAKPVRVESHGNLYLVGCRRTFGPCHSLSF